MKKIIISFALLLALPTIVLAYFQPATLTNGIDRIAVYTKAAADNLFGQGYYLETAGGEASLGAVAGTLHVLPETFLGGISYGSVLATSTSGSATVLRETDLNKYSVFEMTSNVSAFTYTLPATSTLQTLLKNPGDSKTWTFINATSTAATTLTLAKGVGWDLTGVDANVDVIAGAAAGSYVNITAVCTRGAKTSTRYDITCKLTENIATD